MKFSYRSTFVTLGAINTEEVIQFYSQLLNQLPQPYILNTYAEFQLQGLRLAIFRSKVNHELEFSASENSGMSLCWEVEDLEEAIAFLTELGYPPPGETMTASHGREIYAYDPAGNRLILYQK
ncbi:MAG: VOC family protein [Chroococcales cyanobacterium]